MQFYKLYYLLSVHFYIFTSQHLPYLLDFHDFSIFQFEVSLRMSWIVNRELLLCGQETVAATAEDVVEVHEGDCQDQRHYKEEKV